MKTNFYKIVDILYYEEEAIEYLNNNPNAIIVKQNKYTHYELGIFEHTEYLIIELE